MALRLPGREPGLSGGLSSWLGELVSKFNALERELWKTAAEAKKDRDALRKRIEALEKGR